MNCDYHKHLEIWIKFKDFKGLEMSIWYLNSFPFVLVILHHCPYAITMGYHGTEMKYVNTKYCAEQAKVCRRKSHISKFSLLKKLYTWHQTWNLYLPREAEETRKRCLLKQSINSFRMSLLSINSFLVQWKYPLEQVKIAILSTE